MSRSARNKNENFTYHIIVRSVSDTELYKSDSDKQKYLNLIAKYMSIFAFKVYAYCLMDTHAHLIIDCCGADISKIMQGINQCYAQYYNKKYNRHGHLFQDRFKSKIVNTGSYLMKLSGYIHNNPSDIKRYSGKVEEYEFSSLGIYLGISEDLLNLVDSSFVMQLFSSNKKLSQLGYLRYIKTCNEESLKLIIEEKNDESKCLSERKIVRRNINPSDLICYLEKIILKDNNNSNELAFNHRAILCYTLRRFCALNFKDICHLVGLVSESTASKACFLGVQIINSNDEFKNIVQDIMNKFII